MAHVVKFSGKTNGSDRLAKANSSNTILRLLEVSPTVLTKKLKEGMHFLFYIRMGESSTLLGSVFSVEEVRFLVVSGNFLNLVT